MFILFNIIFVIVVVILDTVIGAVIGNCDYSPIYILYNLFVLLPSIAVSVRRMHDIGKSGWFLLISLVPVAGFIWLLVLLCTDGNPGENKYGANPKENV